MEVRGSAFKFTLEEKKVIKKLIDRKYNRGITTPKDYDTSLGEFKTGVPLAIYEATKESLSGSTLERLVGLRSKENKFFRPTTLLPVAKYLNYIDIEHFIKYIGNATSGNKQITSFKIESLFTNHTLRIDFGHNKSIVVRYINEQLLEIVDSYNNKLKYKDTFELEQLEIDEELIFKGVKRYSDKKETSLGRYNSGSNNKVVGIQFLKP